MSSPARLLPGPGAQLGVPVTQAALDQYRAFLDQEIADIRAAGGARDADLEELFLCSCKMAYDDRTSRMQENGEELDSSLLKWRRPAVQDGDTFIDSLGVGSREWYCMSKFVLGLNACYNKSSHYLLRTMDTIQKNRVCRGIASFTEYEVQMLGESVAKVKAAVARVQASPNQWDPEQDLRLLLRTQSEEFAREHQIRAVLVIALPTGYFRCLLSRITTQEKKICTDVARNGDKNGDLPAARSFTKLIVKHCIDLLLEEGHRKYGTGNYLHHELGLPVEVAREIGNYLSHPTVFEFGSGVDTSNVEVELARARQQIDQGDKSDTLKRHIKRLESEVSKKQKLQK